MITLALGTPVLTAAEELPPLPEPLSLADALAFTRSDVPLIELAQAGREEQAAALAEAQSLTGVRMGVVGRLRAVDVARYSINRDRNDSDARLAVSKRLYDFGYSDAREEAARLAGEGGEWRYLDARQEAHLEVMQRFLDVVLADLQYARDNEAMAGAFIAADRARDRHELKRLSDVDLAQLESEYQEALRLRMQSQTQQRAARSRLAIAMGRPNELVANLIRPAAPDLAAPVPDYETVLAEIRESNPEIRALRAEVESARAKVEAARNDHGPVISGELDASYYNRETNTTHPFGASLVLEVPLLTGGAKDAGLADARAKWRASQARLAAAENALSQEVLDLVLRLGNLRLTIEGLKVRGDYRELYLDRSRALYELEVKTDLGDAMTEISAVRLDMAQAEFDWMMTQARLKALAGRLLPEEATK
ncbi:MAG: TolC family protein [Chromatiaceae bacterium]|nr:TolC family protein [Gammaproteobacteria bacterium]MCP5318826.1 TolC family protein [Chromatiaceae bacterium]MCW5585946.1 TolC family protein [Chromatiales bacterium]HOP15648.1 TolC family protein [Gammaproteobacteria bacterium]HPQ25682.1 TolC family protein [Gammaproteobacteria bacterium]